MSAHDHHVVEQLRGQLVVSCQPVPDGPLDRATHIAAMAQAAVAGGAAGLRIEGIDNVAAVRAVCDVPIIGITKRDLPDSPVRITPTVDDVQQLMKAGAAIVAIDATQRPRPEPIVTLFCAVHAAGGIVMADCSCLRDAKAARDAGADILGTTLSGYTNTGSFRAPDARPDEPSGESLFDPADEPADEPPHESANEPDLPLVAALVALNTPVVAEGRYNTPADAQRALAAGAHAVVVGTALTRLEIMTGWFVEALQMERSRSKNAC